MDSGIVAGAGGALGCVVGSFVALVADRWPRGEPIVLARSRCRACGTTLAARDLVPLLSFALAGGRCRHCRANLPPDLLVAEIVGGIVGVLAVRAAPGVPGAAALALFGWSLLLLALLDWQQFWLPDAVTLPLAVAGLGVGSLLLPFPAPLDRMIGATGGYASLEALRIGYRALRGREGLGGGDAKLLAAIGAWLGWQMLPWIVLGAAVLALAGLALAHLRGRAIDATTRVPLGTALAIAALCAMPFAT